LSVALTSTCAIALGMVEALANIVGMISISATDAPFA
jgi:hypothetical protein